MVGLIMSPQAFAGIADGNQLLPECQALVRSMDNEGVNTFDTGHCFGVVQGVADMLAFFKDSRSKKTCIPTTVSYGQDVRIVTKYMQDHPENLNIAQTVLITIALDDAYPCK